MPKIWGYRYLNNICAVIKLRLGSDKIGFYSLKCEETDIVPLKLNWECGWLSFNCSLWQKPLYVRFLHPPPPFSLLGSGKNRHCRVVLASIWFWSSNLQLNPLTKEDLRVAVPDVPETLTTMLSWRRASVGTSSSWIGNPTSTLASLGSLAAAVGTGARNLNWIAASMGMCIQGSSAEFTDTVYLLWM